MAPSLPVVKTLFALSGNVCAYRGCEVKLTNPTWQGVNAHVAHIRGEKPGAARFDPSMTEAERHDFENLILLCPNHHRMIDDLEPEQHTVEMLRQMKHRHESRWEQWASEDELIRYASLAVSPSAPETQGQASLPTARTGGPPRLVAARVTDSGMVDVVNIGGTDAYGMAVEARGWSWGTTDPPPSRLPPGAHWFAGSLGSSGPDFGTPELRVTWRDANGQTFEQVFSMG
jgi:hypothetical protein